MRFGQVRLMFHLIKCCWSWSMLLAFRIEVRVVVLIVHCALEFSRDLDLSFHVTPCDSTWFSGSV